MTPPPRAPRPAATTDVPASEAVDPDRKESAEAPVDPNRKQPVTFECPVALRRSVEALAMEYECSVDYLINEALRQFVRQRAESKADAPSEVPDSRPGVG